MNKERRRETRQVHWYKKKPDKCTDTRRDQQVHWYKERSTSALILKKTRCCYTWSEINTCIGRRRETNKCIVEERWAIEKEEMNNCLNTEEAQTSALVQEKRWTSAPMPKKPTSVLFQKKRDLQVSILKRNRKCDSLQEEKQSKCIDVEEEKQRKCIDLEEDMYKCLDTEDVHTDVSMAELCTQEVVHW